ncbi:MAG TPA: TetR/AcrR family transcriptional regulator [Chthoniobacteraceae bacterium]|nr:TetR/AcrR family transcriptional regulator [Chthoniobacteraceae bacterium]
MKETPAKRNPVATRERLVSAAVRLILRQGFSATSVDQICAEAGVTKGGFFHHFENKDAIGLAAAQGWFDHVTRIYTEALQGADPDPLEQLHAFFDALEGFTRDPDQLCACVVGMLSQEMALVHPGFQSAAAVHFTAWTEGVKKLLVAAREKHPPVRDFDPEGVAWYINSLWQGSIVVAKAVQSASMFRDNLRMAREWIDSFFGLPAAP